MKSKWFWIHFLVRAQEHIRPMQYTTQVEYAAAYCCISRYLQFMSLIGYNPLTAIQIALQNKAADRLTNFEQIALNHGPDRVLRPCGQFPGNQNFSLLDSSRDRSNVMLSRFPQHLERNGKHTGIHLLNFLSIVHHGPTSKLFTVNLL